MDKDKTIFEHIGTPVYLAPEIISEEGYSGFSADIWSLAVTSYIVLTG
jgi:serine/threonine protein kinase